MCNFCLSYLPHCFVLVTKSDGIGAGDVVFVCVERGRDEKKRARERERIFLESE